MTAREKATPAKRGRRADRYESRKATRPGTGTNAPSWTPTTAHETMCALRAGSAASKQELQQYVGMLLKHSNPMAQLGRWMGTKLTPDEKEEVGAILEHHGRKLAAGRSEKLVCIPAFATAGGSVVMQRQKKIRPRLPPGMYDTSVLG